MNQRRNRDNFIEMLRLRAHAVLAHASLPDHRVHAAMALALILPDEAIPEDFHGAAVAFWQYAVVRGHTKPDWLLEYEESKNG